MYRFACKKLSALVLLAATAAPSVAPAAALAFSNQDAAPAAVAANVVTIPDGTELSVVTVDEITSKTATEGDPLTFKVEQDVKINGKTVIAAGTIAKGEVANAKKSGRMGKGGALSIRVLSTTTVDNQNVKLRASKGKEGDDKTGTTVALAVLFGPLGFLKKGKDAKIKPGTKIRAYTDEEKKVAL